MSTTCALETKRRVISENGKRAVLNRHRPLLIGILLTQIQQFKQTVLIGKSAFGKCQFSKFPYKWLYKPKNMNRKQKREFKSLRDSVLKTARAWAIKEFAMSLWHYTSKTWAHKVWKKWLARAVRSRLTPIKEVARTNKKSPLLAAGIFYLWFLVRN